MYIKLVGTFQNGVYYPETTYTWGLFLKFYVCLYLFIFCTTWYFVLLIQALFVFSVCLNYTL
jgi:hypothetical protein